MEIQKSTELAATASASFDDDGRIIRTGTLWTCIAHIITAVIGSGILSLAWSTAQLGWVAAPISMLLFAIVTYVSLFLLSDCYRSPHPVTGTRNYTYMDAVRVNLGNGVIKGSIGGVPMSTSTQKVWRVSQALGDIAFAYPYSLIIIEIQVYNQPVFAFVEKWVSRKFPNSGFVNTFYTITPLIPSYKVNFLRLCFRTTYVVLTTGIAMFFPYFNQVLGVLGALNFWPLAIYFPVEMYFVQRKVGAWTTRWLVLQAFSLVCLLVTIFALVGSFEGLITAKIG